MTHGAHGRGLAGGEGAGDDFFVERPEIFQRAAAPGENQGVEAGSVRQREGADYLGRGVATLYRCGHHDQFDEGGATPEDADDVTYCCAAGRGNHADPLGMGGQAALALGGKQAFF